MTSKSKNFNALDSDQMLADTIGIIDPFGDDGKKIELLELYGIYSPGDFATFLKSVEGKHLQAEINEKLAEISAAQMLSDELYLEQQIIKHRYLSWLFLASLKKKHQNEDDFLLEIEEAIARHLHNLNSHKEAGKVEKEIHVEKSADCYLLPEEMAAEQLNAAILRSNDLEKNFKLLSDEAMLMQHHHKKLDEELLNLDQQLTDIRTEPDKKETLINRHQERVALLTDTTKQQTRRITELLAEGKDKEAELLLTKTREQQMQIASSNDFIKVANGNSVLYNLRGEQVDSFKDAAFILSKEQSLVQKDGRYYLLDAKAADPNINLNLYFASLSMEEQSTAQIKYENKKAELSSCTSLFSAKKNVDLTSYNERRTNLTSQITNLNKDLLQLSSSLANIQQSRLEFESLKKASGNSSLSTPQTKAQQMSAAPTPTPGPNRHQNPVLLASAALSMLELIRLNNQRATIAENILKVEFINKFISWLKQRKVMKDAEVELVKKQLLEMKPGQPIPRAVMDKMRAENFAPAKPRATPAEQKKEAYKSPSLGMFK